MTIIKNYNYSEKKITASVIDITSGEYLWNAYAQASDGYCDLQKLSAHDPSQLYYNIEDIDVTEITKMTLDTSKLYCAVNDTSLLGKIYSLSNPLSTVIDISIPAGITEYPVDVLVDYPYNYYLIPGDSSGTNAKILNDAVTSVKILNANVTTGKIADDAVTYAKVQDISATDKILGRKTAEGGIVEEIACTAAGRALLDDVDTPAQLVTLGVVPLVAAVNLLTQGVEAGYKIARGTVTPDAASVTVVTELTTVVAAVVSFKDAPSLTHMFVVADIGDQDGAPAAGSILIKSYKPTAQDNVTPTDASTPWSAIDWIAIGV